MVVVGVEKMIEFVSTLPRLGRLQVIAVVEFLEVEFFRWQGLPQTKVNAVIGAITWHRIVIGHGLQHFAAAPALPPTVAIGVGLYMAIEAY